MALRDGKIGAMMGGVSRAIGNDVTDVATLERRREAAQKLERKAPTVPFAQVLAAGAGPAEAPRRPGRGRQGERSPTDGEGAGQERGEGQGQGQEDGQPRANEAEGAPRPGGFRPRGRAPIVRG